MKKKPNPKAIGAFVVGAVLLAAAIAGAFGGGRLFTKEQRFVLFFEDSLQGLSIGSPVQFRGVSVGTVDDIRVIYRTDISEILVAAFVDVDLERFDEIGAPVEDELAEIEGLIQRGLRGQLATRSVVTGQQAIQLVFRPDTELRRIGLFETDEVPTIAGGLGQLQETLESDAPELVREARTMVQNAGDFLSDENQELFNRILTDLSKFTAALGRSDKNVEETLAGMNMLVANADETVLEFGELGKRANRILADNEESLKVAIDNAGTAGERVTEVSETANAMLEENRVAIKDFTNTGLYELTNLIEDTQDLVADLRRVVSDLERDPARFLFGDQQQGVETQ